MKRVLDGLRTYAPVLPLILLAAANGVLSTAFLEADDVAHFEYSRWAVVHPDAILEVWGRPLITLFYLVPAQFGPEAARLWSLSLGVAAALLAGRLAERLGAKRPATAALATLSMPYAFVQSYAIMTELFFSVVLATGVLFWRDRRFTAAVLTLTWLPLARPEGFFLGVFFGLAALLDSKLTAAFGGRCSPRRFGLALGLGTGTVAWWLAGLPVYRSADWLIQRWPKNWGAESPYGEGRPNPLFFLAFLALVVTPPLVPAFVAGVRRMWTSRFRLEILTIGFIVVLHSVLWTFRLFGSAGYPRYLVTLAPLLGAATGLGLDGFLDRLARRGPALADPVAESARVERRASKFLLSGALLAACMILLWPNARPYHGDIDVKTLKASAAWFLKTYPEPDRRPFVVVDHPAFRPEADVDADGRSSRFEPLPLAFAPIGSVAVWETKFAARYSKVSRADLARLGFEEVPKRDVAGEPPYSWDGPRPTFPDPELDAYDWGVFIRARIPSTR